MSWISTQELIVRGVPQSAIDKAVADRRLKGTRLSGDEMAFDCNAIDAWLAGRPAGVDASAAKQSLTAYQREEAATVAREHAARAAPPTAGALASAPVSPRKSATEVLDGIVGHIVSRENIGEVEAKRKVLRGSPDLRERLVAEANTDQPQKGTRARPDLANRAAAYDAIPRFGQPVK